MMGKLGRSRDLVLADEVLRVDDEGFVLETDRVTCVAD